MTRRASRTASPPSTRAASARDVAERSCTALFAISASSGSVSVRGLHQFEKDLELTFEHVAAAMNGPTIASSATIEGIQPALGASGIATRQPLSAASTADEMPQREFRVFAEIRTPAGH